MTISFIQAHLPSIFSILLESSKRSELCGYASTRLARNLFFKFSFFAEFVTCASLLHSAIAGSSTSSKLMSGSKKKNAYFLFPFRAPFCLYS